MNKVKILSGVLMLGLLAGGIFPVSAMGATVPQPERIFCQPGETFRDSFASYPSNPSYSEEGQKKIDIQVCDKDWKEIVYIESIDPQDRATLSFENFRSFLFNYNLFYPSKDDDTDYSKHNPNLTHTENPEWLAPSSSVEKIVFRNIKLPVDSSDLFYGVRTQLEFEDTVDTSAVTNMNGMFRYARHFNGSLDTFDTSNVTDMGSMFEGAKSFNNALTFNTANVTDMRDMFALAEAFNAELNFNDTSNVTSMKWMFYGAKAFNQPVNFDTSSVTDMSWMFGSTENFNQLLNFKTSKVENMDGMFLAALQFDQPLNFDFSALRTARGFLANKYIPSDNVDYLKKVLATILTQGVADEESKAVIQDISDWLEGDDGVEALPEAVRTSPFKVFYERTLLLTREKMKAEAIGVPYSLEHYDALLKKLNDTLKNQNVRMHVQANYGCEGQAAHDKLTAGKMDLRDNGIFCFSFKGDQTSLREKSVKNDQVVFDLKKYASYETADTNAGGEMPALTYTIKSGNDKDIFEIKEIDGKMKLVVKDKSKVKFADKKYELVLTVESPNEPKEEDKVREATFIIKVQPVLDDEPIVSGGGSSSIGIVTTGTVITGTLTTGEVKEEPKPEVKEEKSDEKAEVIHADTEIFNPSIENGKCYTRRDLKSIIDSQKIQTSEEFKRALRFLASYEMTIFDSVDAYGPYRNLTREEAAKMFSQFAMNVLCRKPDLNLKTNYIDTKNANPSLKPYIELAYQLGLMHGNGGGKSKFRPHDFISKAEVNAVLMRMILKSYLNEGGSTWYENYNKVSAALNIITQGAGEGAVLRNDVALMLFRAYKNQLFTWQDIVYPSYVLENRWNFVK